MQELNEHMSSQTDRYHWGWEGITLGIMGIVCIGIAVAHQLGLFGTFLAGHELVIILIVLGLIAGYLSLERKLVMGKILNQIIYLSGKIDNISTSLSRMRVFLDGISGDRFSELKALYGMRAFGNTVSENRIETGSSQVFELWLDSLREARLFLAFNHVSSDEVWGTKGWAFRTAHASQEKRMRLGATIGRIFVVSDKREVEVLSDLISAQQKLGIEVRWILKSDAEKIPIVKAYIEEIGTWDYVVIDDDLLFCVAIDDNRKMLGSSLRRDRDLCKKARNLYYEVFERANKL